MSESSSRESDATHVFVVRHGQSQGNVEGRFGGHGPTPLTDHGHRQAAAAGRYVAETLAPTRLISSDLPRAVQTASAIADATGLPVDTDPGFRERSVGEWDDMLFTDVASRFPDDWRRMTERDYKFCPPGAESVDQVFARVGAAIDALIEAHQGERLVLVSHGIAIFHLMSHVFGMPSPATNRRSFALVDNASLSRFRYQAGMWRVVSLNETHYLPDEG